MLSDNDRKYILTQLNVAPDFVLADAMLAFNSFRDKVIAVRKLTNEEKPVEQSPAPAPAPDEAPAPPAERPNVDPGKSAIGKIGGNTKDEIFKRLQNGAKLDRFEEHLKLLWSRGDVKFDGERYYL